MKELLTKYFTPKNVLLFGVFIALISPYLLTRPSYFTKGFDFTTSGQIGDTIGGLTSPIINLISALLIYFSFREQNKANEIQKIAIHAESIKTEQQREIDFLTRQIELVDSKLDSFEYLEKTKLTSVERNNVTGSNRTESEGIAVYKGANGIMLYISELLRVAHPSGLFETSETELFSLSYFNDFYYIIKELDKTFDFINSSNIDIKIKDRLLQKLNLLYSCKIQTALLTLLVKYRQSGKTNALFSDLDNISIKLAKG